MPGTKFKILIADPIHEDGKALLAADPNIDIDVATGLDEAGLIAKVPGCDAVIVRSKSRITKSILAAADVLKAVGRAGIGVDNIDIPAATERGIVVFNTPDSNATTTAELTIAHLMSLSRHLPAADRSVRAKEWQPARFMGTEVAGKTVGIIGFGTIGRLVAERCAALKMKVAAYDPFVTREVMQQYAAEPATLEELLPRADYVSLHCPMTDKTRNLINRERIAKMKAGARIINCARGGLIDETALFDALKSGQIAGAALDVYAKEPPSDSPLITLDNVVLTPHLGASTTEAQQAVSVKIAELISKFLLTGEAETAVNLPRIAPEQFTASRPHQVLAHALGRLARALNSGPVNELTVHFYGRVSALDPRPISTEAVVGFLEGAQPERVNRVNVAHLAAAQGIEVHVSRSEISHDYLSVIEVEAAGGGNRTTVSGTLLGGRVPRIISIDGYRVEAIPEGQYLFTRHHDRPGVVGAVGSILGREKINIQRMNVGHDGNATSAIALISISAPLSQAALLEIRSLPPIIDAVEFAL